MPLTLLDFILMAIMLLSGILALMRGFTREVLSLVAWGIAAVAAYFAIKQQKLIDLAMQNVPYLDKDVLAQIAVGAAAFIITLIVVSIVSVRISDFVVDSAAGAFDRSLGFIFGLARGFVLVAIAYLFYGWLLPFDKQEPWVRNAMTLPIIKSTGGALLALMPPEIAETLSNTALLKNPDQPAGEEKTGEPEGGYKNTENQGLENLIQGTGSDTQQPAAEQGNGQ